VAWRLFVVAPHADTIEDSTFGKLHVSYGLQMMIVADQSSKERLVTFIVLRRQAH